MIYGEINLTDNNFDTMITLLKKAIILSKLIKSMNVLKSVIKLLGSLREMIVKSSIIDNSLFSRLGQMEGV